MQWQSKLRLLSYQWAIFHKYRPHACFFFFSACGLASFLYNVFAAKPDDMGGGGVCNMTHHFKKVVSHKWIFSWKKITFFIKHLQCIIHDLSVYLIKLTLGDIERSFESSMGFTSWHNLSLFEMHTCWKSYCLSVCLMTLHLISLLVNFSH